MAINEDYSAGVRIRPHQDVEKNFKGSQPELSVF